MRFLTGKQLISRKFKSRSTLLLCFFIYEKVLGLINKNQVRSICVRKTSIYRKIYQMIPAVYSILNQVILYQVYRYNICLICYFQNKALYASSGRGGLLRWDSYDGPCFNMQKCSQVWGFPILRSDGYGTVISFQLQLQSSQHSFMFKREPAKKGHV